VGDRPRDGKPCCTVIVTEGGFPDEYGSGANLCWGDVGLDADGNIVCRRAMTSSRCTRILAPSVDPARKRSGNATSSTKRCSPPEARVNPDGTDEPQMPSKPRSSSSFTGPDAEVRQAKARRPS
jgi:hypothetical protein